MRSIFYFSIREFPCDVTGCKSRFQTLLDYEMHYNTSHRYVCTECKMSRPNPRLLEIHIQESHDAFFRVLSEKQAMVIIMLIYLYIHVNLII